MENNEIISKIKSLKKIKPDSDWVSLTKSEVFDNNDNVKKPFFSFDFENVFARSSITAVASFGLIILMVVSAQNASPGDYLYSVKRMTEKGKMMFVSQEDRSDFNTLMAYKRLNEISEIIKRNQIERLSLAIKELEEAKSEMQKDFAKSVENESKEEATKRAREFASNVLEIENEKEMLLGPLGVKVDDSESSFESSRYLLNFLIEDYEQRNLSKRNELLLKEAKDLLEQENYNSGLKVILQIDSERDMEIDDIINNDESEEEEGEDKEDKKENENNKKDEN